jgi:glutamate/tyrosine decarboxylase-like PLP-dependent enzyme
MGIRKSTENYLQRLEHIRGFFLAPVIEADQDHHLLGIIGQALKGIHRPCKQNYYLGYRTPLDYAQAEATRIAERHSSVERTIAEIGRYLEGLRIPGHPHYQMNVSSPATLASIVGHFFGILYNPNLVWDVDSHRVSLAEREVASICAALIGYEPSRSMGFFTFGGTGSLLYGVKLGIEKAEPGAMKSGITSGLKLFSSEAGHYTKLNALGWLGIGTDGLINVPTSVDDSMDLEQLEKRLRISLERNERIACIVATMGTTDAFGIDQLKDIVDLRDRLAAEYRLNYLPHVHADAVIGWAWSVFNDYDYEENPLDFPLDTLRSIKRTSLQIRELHRADSVGIDFHKTGYAPYTSSLFLCKDRKDLESISRDPTQTPYLFQFGGSQPGLYTMECSRSGGAVLSSLANLKLLGKEGYRVLLGQIVTMAESLRAKLDQSSHACRVNAHHGGSVILFRVYPDGIDAKEAYQNETTRSECKAQLHAHNVYNRAIFDQLREEIETEGHGIEISFTEPYRKTNDGELILALKCFVMSPFTVEQDMDTLMICLDRARLKIREK